jgi:hypothetical protein
MKQVIYWILAIHAIAAAYLYFKPATPDTLAQNIQIEGDASSQHAFAEILKTELKRDYNSGRMDLLIRIHNHSAEAISLQPPSIELCTSDQRKVPAFQLQPNAQDLIPAGKAALVTLHYWVEQRDLQNALTLKIQGREIPLKSAEPLILAQIDNQKSKAWAGRLP